MRWLAYMWFIGRKHLQRTTTSIARYQVLTSTNAFAVTIDNLREYLSDRWTDNSTAHLKCDTNGYAWTIFSTSIKRPHFPVAGVKVDLKEIQIDHEPAYLPLPTQAAVWHPTPGKFLFLSYCFYMPLWHLQIAIERSDTRTDSPKSLQEMHITNLVELA